MKQMLAVLVVSNGPFWGPPQRREVAHRHEISCIRWRQVPSCNGSRAVHMCSKHAGECTFAGHNCKSAFDRLKECPAADPRSSLSCVDPPRDTFAFLAFVTLSGHTERRSEACVRRPLQRPFARAWRGPLSTLHRLLDRPWGITFRPVTQTFLPRGREWSVEGNARDSQ